MEKKDLNIKGWPGYTFSDYEKKIWNIFFYFIFCWPQAAV